MNAPAHVLCEGVLRTSRDAVNIGLPRSVFLFVSAA